MIYQNVTPGLLPSEAERLGKITVGTELGWGRAVQAEGVINKPLYSTGFLRGNPILKCHHRQAYVIFDISC